MENLLTLEHVQLGYIYQGHYQKNELKIVVDDLSFALEKGEIGCLLGASGCGKTTVLRAIGGFEPIYNGTIILDKQVIVKPNRMMPPEKRQIGMMFQDYALFPHLTIGQNIAFGLFKLSKQERHRIIDEMLALIGLSDARKSYPHELSGGQQQRVALARAIAPSPKILLLDEPFSNLDVDTREKLAIDVRHILKEKNLSAILVTHNQAEAFAFADKIGVIMEGKLLQWSSPKELLENPINQRVKEYIRPDMFVGT